MVRESFLYGIVIDLERKRAEQYYSIEKPRFQLKVASMCLSV